MITGFVKEMWSISDLGAWLSDPKVLRSSGRITLHHGLLNYLLEAWEVAGRSKVLRQAGGWDGPAGGCSQGVLGFWYCDKFGIGVWYL